jgi:membrane-bound serine protease (ClpP class)
MKRIRAAIWLGLAMLGFAGFAAGAFAEPAARPVVVIPIEGMVDDGMAHLVQRSIAQADAEHARAIVLDVNSLGGLVEAALQIKDAIYAAHEPVIAYVGHRAVSSAALISLSANKIVMAPNAIIGPAEPHPDTAETVAYLSREFESAAQRNHRPAELAGAMVDRRIDLPKYKDAGSFLALNTRDALATHMADAQAPNLQAALNEEGLAGAPVTTAQYTWGEDLARVVNTPQISGLLLTIGLLGLILEMQTLHGIAGFIGISALALFFGTHVYAGFSNGLVIGLALLGLVGILWELHVVPGHGVAGMLGAAALVASVLLAFGIPFFVTAVETLSTAIILAAIAFALLTRYFPRSAWMDRLVLAAAQGPEYVASADFRALRGATGTATSYLRPAGIASIDGKRIDVLTDGEFIPAGTPVRVTRVEGARIFVEPLSSPSPK